MLPFLTLGEMMPFSLDDVVPWGRNFNEYAAMFALDERDLRKRIIACADGPASFNAQATERGYHVVSCDPLYGFDAAAIRERVDAIYDLVVDGMRQNIDEFNWTAAFPTPDAVGATRMAAMRRYLDDYPAGKDAGRYIEASLPALPFDDGAFELALCSHFLFLYSDQFDVAFHAAAIREMIRVAGEVRVFPLVGLGGIPSPHVETVIAGLRSDGFYATQVQVNYEFVIGANQMLIVTRS